MENEEKKVQQLLRVRTASGCVIEGWRMMADNLWFLIRASMPMLLLSSLWGVTILLFFKYFTGSSIAVPLVLTLCGIGVAVCGILQVGILVRKYHILGYFPALRAPWQSKNKSNAPTAINLIAEGLKPAKKTTLQLLVLMIKRARRWGQLLAVMLIGCLSWFVITLIGALPFAILLYVEIVMKTAISLGDTFTIPAWLPVAQYVFAAIGACFAYIGSLTLLLQMAFFGGSLKQENIERLSEQEKQTYI
ncbi:MAG: hypothetical protein K6F94_03075 [Bacteroidaceae bacterium]|nr:hypothetical protein [Bacteroidaceae bacterium]